VGYVLRHLSEIKITFQDVDLNPEDGQKSIVGKSIITRNDDDRNFSASGHPMSGSWDKPFSPCTTDHRPCCGRNETFLKRFKSAIWNLVLRKRLDRDFQRLKDPPTAITSR